MTDEATEELFAKVPPPPKGSAFSLVELRNVTLPHPYVIGLKHVEIAADRFGGMLGQSAIEEAERQGVGCYWEERTHGRCRLSYREHETQLTLFVRVPQNEDLNAVPGLKDWLVSVKQFALDNGIQGFAFPK